MSAANAIPLVAVATANERVIFETAASHLAQALSQASGQAWTCSCEFVADLDGAADKAAGAVVVTSLLASLTKVDTPWADVEQALRAAYSALSETGAPILICTILRHVPAGDDRETADRIRQRVARLNLLATELSREYGALVIDLDRILADIGAQRLETDYRLGGPIAAGFASNAVAVSIVANALDDFAPVDLQDVARVILESQRPAVGMASEIKLGNMMALGQGRRKQRVATVTDTVQENHVGWLVRQVLKRQIGPAEAMSRLGQAVRSRGARESLVLLATGVGRLFRRPS